MEKAKRHLDRRVAREKAQKEALERAEALAPVGADFGADDDEADDVVSAALLNRAELRFFRAGQKGGGDGGGYGGRAGIDGDPDYRPLRTGLQRDLDVAEADVVHALHIWNPFKAIPEHATLLHCAILCARRGP